MADGNWKTAGEGWVTRSGPAGVWVGPTGDAATDMGYSAGGGTVASGPRAFIVVAIYAHPKSGVSAGCFGIDSAWDDRDAAEARAREVAADPKNGGAWVEAWSLRRAEVVFAREPA